MATSTKRFEDWVEVDCNDCSHYWDDSCDGVKTSVKGSGKRCTAFLATKRVDIPLQIKTLRSTLKWLLVGFIVETVWVVITTILLGVLVLG